MPLFRRLSTWAIVFSAAALLALSYVSTGLAEVGNDGDGFDGQTPALLEHQVVNLVRSAGLVERTTVRSFDHRCVRALRQLEPGLTGAVLIAETAPVAPADLAKAADASVYCPDLAFLDEALVRQAHAGGVRVVPWTANEPADWLRLLEWQVDGATTDYPDRLAALLRAGGITF